MITINEPILNLNTARLSQQYTINDKSLSASMVNGVNISLVIPPRSKLNIIILNIQNFKHIRVDNFYNKVSNFEIPTFFLN